jgi:hypothetical protein
VTAPELVRAREPVPVPALVQVLAPEPVLGPEPGPERERVSVRSTTDSVIRRRPRRSQ